MTSSPAWLSVIIPAHNAAATIEHTLDSLQQQEVRAWEAIVIADRCSDATEALVAARIQRDARIRLISMHAGSASAARNAGLTEAQGTYLLFLDSDDWIDPHYMVKMRAALERAPRGAVAFCAYSYVNARGEQLPAQYEPRIEQAPAEIFTRQCGVSIHCVVIERTLVQRLGGFDTKLRTCEDWDLWYRVARSGVVFVGVPEPLALYRMSPGSLTSDSAQLIRDGMVLLERTFGDDARLPAAQRGPGTDSLGLGDRALWMTYLYVWFLAVDVGRGKSTIELLSGARPPPGMLHRVGVLSETIVGAMLVGAACPPAKLASRAETFAAPLQHLCEALETLCAEPGLGRALAYDCERRILHLSGLHSPMALSRVMGARLDRRRPLGLEPPPSVDLLYLMVCDGERVIGNIDVPILGGVQGEPVLARIMLDAAGPRWFVRCVSPARRSRFAAYFTAYAARRVARFARKLPRMGPGAPGLRKELSTAARVAAERAAGPVVRSGSSRDSVARGPRGSAQEYVPVLMYHRVAERGPAELARYRITPEAFRAQMQLLHRRGFYAMSSATLSAHLLRDQPFPGRPVVLTFDDGYADFGALAWPILREFSLQAEVFIVSDLVGQAAHWDSASGPAAPLMGWAEIRALSAQGVTFGSHLASHRRVDTLSTRELDAELRRSRATLEQQLGKSVRSIAAPFGFVDSRYLWLAREAGYHIGYSTRHGSVQLGASSLALQRLEVRGDMQLPEFEGLLAPQQ
jgi:peptidoglycan/xylan/chitin deacetylase (PgdA/CDA1 family)/GT2 family glycosyltransferase